MSTWGLSLEQLGRCAQGLAQALSKDALRVAVLRYVPGLLQDALDDILDLVVSYEFHRFFD